MHGIILPVNHQRDGTLSSQRPRLHDGRNPAVRDQRSLRCCHRKAIGGIKEIYAAFQRAFNDGRLLFPAVSMRDYHDLARQRSYSRGKVGKREGRFFLRGCIACCHLPYSSYFKLHVLRLHLFTPVTYLCKLLGFTRLPPSCTRII